MLLVQEGAVIPDDHLPANLDPRAVGLHDEAREGFAGWGLLVRIGAGEQEVPGEDRDGGSAHPQQSDTAWQKCRVVLSIFVLYRK